MQTRLLKLTIFVLLCAASGFYALSASAYSGGPPTAYTSAPGEANCRECHLGNPLNSSLGSLTISGLSGTYSPNQEFNLTVMLVQANRARYGFQLTVLDDQGRKAGDIIRTDAARTLLGAQVVLGNLRQYINHSFDGHVPITPGQNSWTFTWKAPAQSVGRVTFYVAGNAANGSGTDGGDYIYTINQSIQPSAVLSTLTSVSGASFTAPPLAADSISAAFGTGLAQNVVVASTSPLPTQLDGTEVEVKDSLNTARNAGLFFVAPGQVNYLIPGGTATGAATVTLRRNGTAVAQGTVNIDIVAPALFAANNNGVGVPAAVLFRRRDGVDTFETIAAFNATTNKFEATPIDLGPGGDLVVLILFGTGFRNNTNLSLVTATIGGTIAPVLFAGSQGPEFAGLDQANVTIPRSLIGRGNAELVLNVAGKEANRLQINLK